MAAPTTKNNEIRVEGENIIVLEIKEQAKSVEASEKSMTSSLGELREILTKNPTKSFKLLLDMRKVKTRNLSKRQTERNDSILSHGQLERVAFVGSGRALAILVNFTALATGKRSRIRFFTQIESAYEWLKNPTV